MPGEQGGLWPLSSALAGAIERETPTSNLTESTSHTSTFPK